MSIPKQPRRKSTGTPRSLPNSKPARRKIGRPANIPEVDPTLPATLKKEDLSWVPDEVRHNRTAYRETLRVFLACRSVHHGVNDIDRMQITEFGRAYLRLQQFNALAQSEYEGGDTKEYMRAVKGANTALILVRAILRDLKLLRVTGLKVSSTTPTEESGWKGLL